MKIVVTGGHGLLGSDFVRVGAERGHECVPLGRDELDVTDRLVAERVLGELAPDWVVHCAAYTAVDRAEEEPEAAFRVNRDGAENVARGAAAAGARVVYISSDYVFDGLGSEPYRVTDPVGPVGVYARSKLAGELAVMDGFGAMGARVAGAGGRRAREVTSGGPMIVRTGWLYGESGHHFVRAILARGRAGKPLSVVEDQRGRPTWTRNVAETVLELMERPVEGVWHVADGGDATWLELAREALSLAGVEAPVRGVTTEEWGAAAPRPRYSVLDLSGTERELGRPAMPWNEALRRYLEGEPGLEAVA